MGFVPLVTGLKAVAGEEATTERAALVFPRMLGKKSMTAIPDSAWPDLRQCVESGFVALGGAAAWNKLKDIVLPWAASWE